MSKSMVNNENYYVVQGWMRNVLGLRGNALDIYAIIYGFSQVSHQEFTASINYLCEWLGASRPTVINTLKDLVERGYLTKESNEINGVIYNRYTAVVPDLTGGKEILLPSKNILPNNIDNNIDKNNSLSKDKEEQAPPTKKSASKSTKKKSYKDVYSLIENVSIRDSLVRYVNKLKEAGRDPKVSDVEKWAKALLELSGEDSKQAEAIVQQSIDREYYGIYPLKKSYNSYSVKKEAVSIPAEQKDKAKNPDGSYVVF